MTKKSCWQHRDDGTGVRDVVFIATGCPTGYAIGDVIAVLIAGGFQCIDAILVVIGVAGHSDDRYTGMAGPTTDTIAAAAFMSGTPAGVEWWYGATDAAITGPTT